VEERYQISALTPADIDLRREGRLPWSRVD
jgi:hypothetical protein